MHHEKLIFSNRIIQTERFHFQMRNITNSEYTGLLTVCRQQELCCVLLRQPSDLVDLLFDLKAFQVVELRLMALEGAVNIVFSSALRLILTLNKDISERSLGIILLEIDQKTVFQVMYDPKHQRFLFNFTGNH